MGLVINREEVKGFDFETTPSVSLGPEIGVLCFMSKRSAFQVVYEIDFSKVKFVGGNDTVWRFRSEASLGLKFFF